MRVGLAAAACAFAFSPLAAQDSTRTVQDSAARVFLDCPDTFCDFDYYHTEITFVNWVRDRQYAQVHVLITTQSTGGGREYTLGFIGLERFAGEADTLRWNSKADDTEDDIRRGLAQTMRLGLVRFAARTPVARLLQLSYAAPAQAAAQVRDPWNYWVFRADANLNLNGEKTFKYQNWWGSLSADRITEQWKIRFSLNSTYSQSDYTYVSSYDSTGAPIEASTRTITRGYDANSLIVRSVGAHWSAGGRVFVSSSTYLNQELVVGVAPAVEYDVVPYSQSTRELLTFRYQIGPTAYRYNDTTIYNQIEETRFYQSLNVSLSVKQPWGSTGVALEGGNYLHDFTKNRLTIFGNGQFRIFKGLSLQFFGSVALIHDQLFISKEGATEQEVLLRRRQLETSYRYFGYFSLSYTFGSKFANIVNPRFEGGGGNVFF
ncbi:MAG: hypothetical protein DMD62_07720 [Gemmatimonadetes bacterium]|nr:MAG: hypothetical protein DMD62_07720 [Gemmatimonadota bacterium]